MLVIRGLLPCSWARSEAPHLWSPSTCLGRRPTPGCSWASSPTTSLKMWGLPTSSSGPAPYHTGTRAGSLQVLFLWGPLCIRDPCAHGCHLYMHFLSRKPSVPLQCESGASAPSQSPPPQHRALHCTLSTRLWLTVSTARWGSANPGDLPAFRCSGTSQPSRSGGGGIEPAQRSP